MSRFDIRPLDPHSPTEVDQVCAFSVMTLWESRPEMRVDPATLPHFGFAIHKKLILAGADNPSQQHLVARDDEARVVGHSIALVRESDQAPYGYFWSRYVLPRYRRQGLGRRFLKRNLEWMASQPLAYAEVHIHVDNAPLRYLFEREGFQLVDRRTERWTFLVLRHELL